jgi:hypothetical protein
MYNFEDCLGKVSNGMVEEREQVSKVGMSLQRSLKFLEGQQRTAKSFMQRSDS